MTTCATRIDSSIRPVTLCITPRVSTAWLVVDSGLEFFTVTALFCETRTGFGTAGPSFAHLCGIDSPAGQL